MKAHELSLENQDRIRCFKKFDLLSGSINKKCVLGLTFDSTSFLSALQEKLRCLMVFTAICYVTGTNTFCARRD